MREVEPKVLLIGATRLFDEAVNEYLEHIGAPEWGTDAPSDAEKLAEMMGRLCYRSFAPGLNPNVTQVREGNKKYLEHIIDVGHGSVIEHAQLNFIFLNVSRVFTHELVRHRIGVGISQESLRYVRLTDLGFWLPTVIKENKEAHELFLKTITQLEEAQRELARIYDIDNLKDFNVKKEITSAMRRIAPDGLATYIGWSANFRTLRHVIEMRTDPAAEEEIRLVFGKVADIVTKEFPNVFGDYAVEMVKGLPWYKTTHRKI